MEKYIRTVDAKEKKKTTNQKEREGARWGERGSEREREKRGGEGLKTTKSGRVILDLPRQRFKEKERCG